MVDMILSKCANSSLTQILKKTSISPKEVF